MVMLRVYKGVQRRDEYMVVVAVAETVIGGDDGGNSADG